MPVPTINTTPRSRSSSLSRSSSPSSTGTDSAGSSLSSSPTTSISSSPPSPISFSSSSSSCISVPAPTLAPSTKFVMPDLVSHCPYTLRINPHYKKANAGSISWLLRTAGLTSKKAKAVHGLKCGLLASMCYPDAPPHEIRVCCDYINYLFHFDNISDLMSGVGAERTSDVVMNVLYHPTTYKTSVRVGKMTKDFWRRLTPTATPGTLQRFMSTSDQFLYAVTQQAKDRENNTTPDLESYIALRRDTSGCKQCWALIEYCARLDLPEEVFEHPVVAALGEAANDLVTWSNDIFSYNVEQARRDTHNMIAIVMSTEHLPLQDAVDFVGTMCKAAIDRFVENKAVLPSFGYLEEVYPVRWDGRVRGARGSVGSGDGAVGAEGEEGYGGTIDEDVRKYVQGLQDWIVGSLHWSFETERYFGKAGQVVKRSRVVQLLPRRALVLTQAHTPNQTQTQVQAQIKTQTQTKDSESTKTTTQIDVKSN